MLRTIEHDLAELLLHRSMIRASLGNTPKADTPESHINSTTYYWLIS
jgi:hypothetical protein